MANPMQFVFGYNFCPRPCKKCDKLLKMVRAIEGVHSLHTDESATKLAVIGTMKLETVIKKIKENRYDAKFLWEKEEIYYTNKDQGRKFQKVAPEFSSALIIHKNVDKQMEIKETTTLDCTKHGRRRHEFEQKYFNKPFKCNRCREEGFACWGYRCKHCVYDIHKDCLSPKPEVTHDFFQGCTFVFSQKPGKICDACGLEIHGHSYGCRTRNLDLHPACSKLPLRISGTDFELSSKVEYKCFYCNLKKPRWPAESGMIRGLCYVSKKNKVSCHVHCVSLGREQAWKRGEWDCKDSDDNGITKTLNNLDWKLVANYHVKQSGGKGGNLFLKVVTIFLKTVIGVLFGDPTGLVVSVATGVLTR